MQVIPGLTQFPVIWKNAGSFLCNQKNYIHVFKMNLEKLSVFTDSFLPLLSQKETEKANRYSNVKDKHSCIIRWAVTRLLLAKYCGRPPEKLSFSTGKNGKPHLVQDNSSESLFFNLSFSGNYALIAVSNRETGVDIELIQPDFNFREVLDFVFSPQEKNSILGSANPLAAFYLLFTRKEAIVKALGTGIHDQMPGVSVLGHNSFQLAAYKKETGILQLISFEVTQNHIASLAFYTETENLQFFVVDQYWLTTVIQ